MNPSAVIKTARLTLRRFRLTDAEDMFAFTSDPDVCRYTPWQMHESPLVCEAVIALRLALGAECFAVTLPGDDIAIGSLLAEPAGDNTSTDENTTAKEYSVGFTLAKAYWGQGIMTEALTAFCEYLFSLGARRLTAVCDSENTACRALLKKTGFSLATSSDISPDNAAFSSYADYTAARPVAVLMLFVKFSG